MFDASFLKANPTLAKILADGYNSERDLRFGLEPNSELDLAKEFADHVFSSDSRSQKPLPSISFWTKDKLADAVVKGKKILLNERELSLDNLKESCIRELTRYIDSRGSLVQGKFSESLTTRYFRDRALTATKVEYAKLLIDKIGDATSIDEIKALVDKQKHNAILKKSDHTSNLIVHLSRCSGMCDVVKREALKSVTLESFRDAILNKDYRAIQDHLQYFDPIQQVPDPQRNGLRDWIINYAVQTNDLTIVQLIVEAAKPHEFGKQYDVRRIGLDKAIKQGSADIVDYLLSMGAKPSPSVLYEAALLGNKQIVELLVNAGASVEEAINLAYNKYGQWASGREQYQQIANILFDYAAGSDFPSYNVFYPLELNNLCLFGVSVQGVPVRLDQLRQNHPKPENSLLTINEIDNLPDERRTAILKNIDKIAELRGGVLVANDGIAYLQSIACLAEYGDIELVKTRLQAGCNPNEVKQNYPHEPALILAISNNHLDIARLLASHPQMNRPTLKEAIKICERDHPDLVEFLSLLYDVNALNEKGDAPIHIAAKKADIDAIKRLLSYPNIDVNKRNGAGHTALEIIAKRADKPLEVSAIIKLLIERKADVGDCKNRSALYNAVAANNYEAVSLLIPHVDKSPIRYSSFTGNTECPWYDQLLSIGLHAVGKRSFNKMLVVFEILRDHGADLNAIDSNGNRLIHLAIEMLPSVNEATSRAQQFKFLHQGLDRGVNLEQEYRKKSIKGYTDQFNETYNFLLGLIQLGVKPTVPNDVGMTPLHILLKQHPFNWLEKSEADLKDMLKPFIETGDELHAADNKGKTPIQYAEQYNPSLVSLLNEISDERKSPIKEEPGPTKLKL
ncbi:ankyrin repeat domain-containing protein [Legionella genomosp. 1]|uniref:ankyrin repeat domain-containing protein n=1 Tax=Legionella genomosp. 1 TaxID=1093625 RepID=UPI0013EF83D7|nr:ankyrin repeat domain-containing protein [Legionella genomosp. 1]